VCGEPIDFYDRNGVLLGKWKYEQRKTCGSECYATLHTKYRKVEEYVPQPIDLFLQGKLV
jgi:hypothetical protein